jgi:hypothetical protein
MVCPAISTYGFGATALIKDKVLLTVGCTNFSPMYLFIAKYLFTGVFFLIIWLELSLFDLWLFLSFYLRRSSAENLVERDFLIKNTFPSHASLLKL